MTTNQRSVNSILQGVYYLAFSSGALFFSIKWFGWEHDYTSMKQYFASVGILIPVCIGLYKLLWGAYLYEQIKKNNP